MVKLIASYDEEVKAVVLSNAPQNAKYTSHQIQKQILDLIAFNVQTTIRDEIGDAKFCLIVDESRDESRREQMALVVRFVYKGGFIRERFLDLIHVHDTSSATLKKELDFVLSHHKLDVQNIRGQGYDGASNMRGEWNGLQAKFVEECPYAYYVHCFAHQLQLALVAASKEVTEVHNFFEHLALIVNTVVSSTKRNDDLRANQVAEIEHLIELNEIEIGRVLKDIAIAKGSGTTVAGRAKAAGAIKLMMSFDFIFIMHVMKELMGVTDLLCKKLQHKSQDIVNAMDDVATTKRLIQNLRDHGNEITIEHHYRYDIFPSAVDQQAQELNHRFSEQFYPADFSEQERSTLRLQLQHYEFDVPTNSKFQNLTTVADLCRRLAETGKSDEYYLIDRLIRLVLTLPVSTATTERAFSAMKLVKTRLRSRMEDEFLRNCLITYIEKEIAIQFATDKLIDNFNAIQTRRVALK
eukprot:XP_008654053.1 zinc finger MYM-type protein 1-like [Zea mays]